MLEFEKWQGLGNDFIVLRGVEVTPAEAQRLCDRRFGVGADGVLMVLEPEGEPPRMVVINADGSRPEMCGNGLRCVVGSLAAGQADGDVAVATDAGLKPCTFRRAGEGFDVSVEMGRARLGEPLTFEHGGRSWQFARVDMGNPHAVSFDPHEDAELDGVGPALEQAEPQGVNVELCRVVDGGIDVIVWERGVGRTLACGTGACAVAAAACDAGHFAHGRPIGLRLPGGPLTITVAESGDVTMEGPARLVFAGRLALDGLEVRGSAL